MIRSRKSAPAGVADGDRAEFGGLDGQAVGADEAKTPEKNL